MTASSDSWTAPGSSAESVDVDASGVDPNDPDAVEEYAEQAGVDPSPQQVDQYVELQESPEAAGPSAEPTD